MKARKRGDEIKSDDEKKDEDKFVSKFDGADDGNVSQKFQKEREEVVENTGEGKRKRIGDFKTGELTTNRIKIAEKLGTVMSVVVVVLSAVMLGIYVKNLIVPAKNYKD